MEKIKIVVDSSTDLTRADAERYGIDIVPLYTLLDEKIYEEGTKLTPAEVYEITDHAPDRLKTSQATPEGFLNTYQRLYKAGYTAAFVLTLNSGASGTYQSAVIARELFFEENGGAVMKIEVIDSKVYTGLIAYGGMQMNDLVQAGASFEEVKAFAEDYFSRIEAIANIKTLNHLRRTGRISGFESFVGGILDIKPLIRVSDGNIVPFAKIKGQKNVLPKMITYINEAKDPLCRTGAVITGRKGATFEADVAQIKRECGFDSLYVFEIGCTLCINTGPEIFGISYLRKK